MELTKEHFDKVLKTFATKEDTTAIRTGMAKLATAEELATVKQDVATIKKTVMGHTTSLDSLLTKKKTKDDAKIISVERFDNLEHWARQVGDKLGISLEL